jgi:hypothetical protein
MPTDRGSHWRGYFGDPTRQAFENRSRWHSTAEVRKGRRTRRGRRRTSLCLAFERAGQRRYPRSGRVTQTPSTPAARMSCAWLLKRRAKVREGFRKWRSRSASSSVRESRWHLDDLRRHRTFLRDRHDPHPSRLVRQSTAPVPRVVIRPTPKGLIPGRDPLPAGSTPRADSLLWPALAREAKTPPEPGASDG